MYEVTLKDDMGKTYDIGGVVLKEGVPKIVSESLGNYLKDNPKFKVEVSASVTKEQEKEVSATDGPFEESELKKLSKAQQESLIKQLSGDLVPSANNSEKRVALILELQEKGA